MKETIIGCLISVIIAIITYFVGSRKRYNKTLYCHNSRDYMVVTTGTFSDKMVVQYDRSVIKGNIWCIYRTFANIEKTDIMCGDEFISIKTPNGKWLEAKIGMLTENLDVEDFSVVISDKDPSILQLRFKNIRENDGFVLQGLLETNEAKLEPLKINHRIPDLNKVKIAGYKTSYIMFLLRFLIAYVIAFPIMEFLTIHYDFSYMSVMKSGLCYGGLVFIIESLLKIITKRTPRKVERIVENLFN